MTGQIQLMQHLLLVGPRLLNRKNELHALLIFMNKNPQGREVLQSLGLDSWQTIEKEEVEFMIDLVSTLIK